MIFDPAVARLAILEALKEEFMDLMDDGKTTTAELVELNKDLTDFAAEILDAFNLEVTGSPEDGVFDIRLRLPIYDETQEPV